MIGLLQRVSQASVVVEEQVIGQIGTGLAVLVAVERRDTEAQADRLLERLLSIRVFADEAGRMNLNVVETGGSLLLVPQFTLAADTKKGNRPGFSRAADPEEGQRLFEYLLSQAWASPVPVASGRFGTDMQVNFTNEGPVTLWLEVAGYH